MPQESWWSHELFTIGEKTLALSKYYKDSNILIVSCLEWSFLSKYLLVIIFIHFEPLNCSLFLHSFILFPTYLTEYFFPLDLMKDIPQFSSPLTPDPYHYSQEYNKQPSLTKGFLFSYNPRTISILALSFRIKPTSSFSNRCLSTPQNLIFIYILNVSQKLRYMSYQFF